MDARSILGLESSGMLTEPQANRFFEYAVGDTLAYLDARSCLHWYQRPFHRWLITHPGPFRVDVRSRALAHNPAP
jgi:hypothetical protein